MAQKYQLYEFASCVEWVSPMKTKFLQTVLLFGFFSLNTQAFAQTENGEKPKVEQNTAEQQKAQESQAQSAEGKEVEDKLAEKLEKDAQGEDESLDDISGLIVNRTMTRFGQDFYSIFSQFIADKASSENENLSITERATALSGSIISIRHGQKIIYRTALSPARSQIEFKAKQAVDAVDKYLLQWKIQQHFQDTFDLAKDEI